MFWTNYIYDQFGPLLIFNRIRNFMCAKFVITTQKSKRRKIL